ncbi:alpha-mannosidase [Paenibacillus spongiae]|uniref:Glycosyl hydrolase-related protein n=1 Tax=Paenibacillus spongiae TaxID=2909671 RepID=A0ABY5S5I3_9BACL|nr:glycoside hydrolase family 38 C-terminal domain-containing protein [Paenibacillus spongiae]UVI27583.1 glycosyl hydrolase-related protein [Paenibacillus spongiae]
MPYETVRPGQLKNLLRKLDEQIYKPLVDLKVTAWVTKEPVAYEDRMSGQKIELASGDRWGNLWDCAWFHFAGKVPATAKGAKVVLLIDVNGEVCLVDDEGTPAQGLTNINSEFDYELGLPGKRVVHISASSSGDETIDLWGDAGCNDLFGRYRSGTLKEAVIAVCREEVRQLYYDVEVLLETAERLPDGSARKERILKVLYDVSLHLTEISDERVAAARRMLGEQLAKQGGDPVLTVSAIGHAHIDLAWLWPIRETIRKGARTFSTALRMMERYPDYVFGASQPQLYDWMKKHYPKLYDQVKERVKEGRWEPQGAMWVESDTNVPGGEALVRQVLYGKRYFQQEFGMEMKSLWMPDVFGYTASLPQILKKSGVDYMMTQKLSWSVYNKFPHHTFMWEGIDGSKVLTHMPPEDTYNSPAAPRSIAKAEAEYLDKNVSDHCLMLFGIGDGGGGPGEEHLERLDREKNLLGLSPVVQEPSAAFFDKLSEGADRYQSWRGELYLEKHQGTLTSQGRSKRYNRKLEKALRELEFASILAGVFAAGRDGKGVSYPAVELEEIWKEVLLYQFHDILPGSSIKRVYDESLERYGILEMQVEALISNMYGSLAEQLAVTGREEESQAVFNSLSWERDEWLKADGKWMRVRVPSMGYAVASGHALSDHEAAAAVETAEEASTFNGLRSSAADRSMENDLLSVVFAEDGSIVSVFDKEHQREVIESGGSANALRIYHDEGDAWDFRQDYRQTGGMKLDLVETSEFADGPTAGLIHRYQFGNSTLTQKVALTHGSRRIDFVTTVDWKESDKMLRTSFPVDVRSETVSCEIQFGYLQRPTHRNTMWDYAKDEICAHHWMDLSDAEYGVALLNDSKYGHRAENNVLDLNLLRSPNYPDPEADRAEHTFTYALYPHKGNHVQAEIYKRGYELNVPLRTVPIKPSDGTAALPALQSCLQISHPNVMVEAVKQAEDGDDVIIRLYETAGAHAKTRLHTGFDLNEAWLTDLMEETIGPLAHSDGSVELSFTPFEIQTVRLRLQR